MKRMRSVLAVAMAAAVVLVAGACASSTDDDVDSPVKLSLPDGRSITVPKTPERIVTLGGQWTDVALSFGVTPVGYYDGVELQTKQKAPWYGDKLNDSTLINLSDDVVGSVANLKPDLILAPGFASMGEDFDKLSKLAPTIDKISGAQIDPWEEMVTVMGTILHQPDKAKEIISGVTAKVNQLATDTPGLKGKTYAFAYLYGSDGISVLGDESDGAAKLFAELGLVLAPRIVQESKKSGQPRVQLSTENISLLDADVLIVASQTPELQKRVASLPGYKSLKAVKNGAVATMSQVQITGLNEPSPNSIPYALGFTKDALKAAAKS